MLVDHQTIGLIFYNVVVGLSDYFGQDDELDFHFRPVWSPQRSGGDRSEEAGGDVPHVGGCFQVGFASILQSVHVLALLRCCLVSSSK